MKKLMMILIAVATLQLSAQEQKREIKKQRMESKTPYTPEQMAQLKSKKMTLHLDLNEKQQKEVTALFLEQSKKRSAKKESYSASKTKEDKKTWSNEDRFKMANARLDRQIDLQRKMKTILNEDQFEKYIKMNARNTHRTKRFDQHYKHKMSRRTSENSKS